MNTFTKILITTVAAGTIATGAAKGDTLVRRIDHPNGPPTFVAVPQMDRASSTAVYGDGYIESEPAVLVVEEAPGNTDSLGRTLIPIHRGRGQVFYVPIER